MCVCKNICNNEGRLVVVLEECVSNLKHEEDILLRKNVETWISKVRDANSLCYRSFLSQLHKRREHASIIYHHLTNSNTASAYHSGPGSQEI